MECIRFINFAIDGASVETHAMLLTSCEFLDGKINYCVAVDNNYNVKNDRYQLVGGSNGTTMGKYCISTNLLIMSHASFSLLAPKDFASDKRWNNSFPAAVLIK